MAIEVERKYRITSSGEIRRKVESLGGRFAQAIQQSDSYFAHPSRDFASTDEALRIRRVGPENVMTYKGPKLDRDSKSREEIEIPLGQGDTAAQGTSKILERLGFRPVLTVTKLRCVANVAWNGFEVEAALDEVSGAGLFVELETQAETDDLEQAKECIRSLAAELGLREADQERRSYLELVLNAIAANR